MVTTAARRWCIPLAIRCFQKQSWTARELVIASEDAWVESLVPRDDPRVRFVPTPAGISLGEKHNAAVEACRHEWLAKWDDDDWHAPRRLGLSLRHLAMSELLLASTRQLIFHELHDPRRTFLYTDRGGRPWLAGNALVFHRRIWRRTPFPDRDSGVDTVFVWNVLSRDLGAAIDDPGIVVVLQHGQTTGRKVWTPEPPEYEPWPGRVEDLMGSDLARYEAAFAIR